MKQQINPKQIDWRCDGCHTMIIITRRRKRNLCRKCRRELIQNNIIQLKRKAGPNYEKWKANLAKSLKRKREE